MSAEDDIQHLRLLSIFHYVFGALAFLCGSVPWIHVALGIGIISGALPAGEGREGPPPAFGWLFVVIGGAAILLSYALAGCALLAGKYLNDRTHRTFCVVVAALVCLNMPLGTVLGVLTLIVLHRPSVRAMFEGPKRAGPGDLAW